MSPPGNGNGARQDAETIRSKGYSARNRIASRAILQASLTRGGL
jgi:hypothetical protein